MTMTLGMWKMCGVLPDTVWAGAGDSRGCRLDDDHDGQHLIEFPPPSATELPDKFNYRLLFGGL